MSTVTSLPSGPASRSAWRARDRPRRTGGSRKCTGCPRPPGRRRRRRRAPRIIGVPGRGAPDRPGPSATCRRSETSTVTATSAGPRASYLNSDPARAPFGTVGVLDGVRGGLAHRELQVVETCRRRRQDRPGRPLRTDGAAPRELAGSAGTSMPQRRGHEPDHDDGDVVRGPRPAEHPSSTVAPAVGTAAPWKARPPPPAGRGPRRGGLAAALHQAVGVEQQVPPRVDSDRRLGPGDAD